MKNYPKTLHIPSLEPQGGIYSHQGRGGPGARPWPKTRPGQRPYGRCLLYTSDAADEEDSVM